MDVPHPGIEVLVQSTHVDMFGHLNHTRYLEYMEWCRFDWAQWHGFPIDRMVSEERRGPALLRVQIQYRKECRLGDRLRVTAQAVSARRRIGVVHQEVWNRVTEELVCEAEISFVMMDLLERKAVELPPAFLAEVRRHAASTEPGAG